MEIGLTNKDNYKAIANAIREKNGSTETYTPSEMADAIAAIPTPDVDAYIETHNTSADAHPDIRDTISQKTLVQIITLGVDD